MSRRRSSAPTLEASRGDRGEQGTDDRDEGRQLDHGHDGWRQVGRVAVLALELDLLRKDAGPLDLVFQPDGEEQRVDARPDGSSDEHLGRGAARTQERHLARRSRARDEARRGEARAGRDEAQKDQKEQLGLHCGA